MPGSPRKRAKREALAAIESGAIPVVAKELPSRATRKSGVDRLEDPAWVEKAWAAYLLSPTVTGLASALGVSNGTATLLIQRGGKGSLPFAARLHAITVAKNVEPMDDEAAALKESLRGLAKVARTQTRLATAFDRDSEDDEKKATPAILMAAKAPPKELKALTDGLAKSAEVFQALTAGRALGQNKLDAALEHATDANQALAHVLDIIAGRSAERT